MDMTELNAVYEQVLGEGPVLEDEQTGAPPAGAQDGAYSQEDYGDDAEDGTDPRDDSTLDEDAVKEYIEDDEPFEGEEVDDEEYEEVPARLVEAGRNANLSERDIVELAETHPEALEALARSQEQAYVTAQPTQQQSVEVKEAQTEPTAGGLEPLKLDFDEDDREEMGERSIKIINTLVDKVNLLAGKVSEQQETTQTIKQQSDADRIRVIDETFDEMAEEIPGLGMSSTLTAEQKANRRFAFGAAREAMTTYGNMSIEQALTIGANAVRGQMTDTQVKAKLVSDLNKNKKRFTARAKGRRRTEPRKSVDDRAIDAISKVLNDPKYH
jgi:hypothetical protein